MGLGGAGVSRHVLYRWWDDQGRLVYLGITNNAGRRTDEHASKPWANLCVSMTVEQLPDSWSRAEVLAYEAERIEVERPMRNIIGNRAVRRRVTRRPRRPARRRRHRKLLMVRGALYGAVYVAVVAAVVVLLGHASGTF